MMLGPMLLMPRRARWSQGILTLDLGLLSSGIRSQTTWKKGSQLSCVSPTDSLFVFDAQQRTNMKCMVM